MTAPGATRETAALIQFGSGTVHTGTGWWKFVVAETTTLALDVPGAWELWTSSSQWSDGTGFYYNQYLYSQTWWVYAEGSLEVGPMVLEWGEWQDAPPDRWADPRTLGTKAHWNNEGYGLTPHSDSIEEIFWHRYSDNRNEPRPTGPGTTTAIFWYTYERELWADHFIANAEDSYGLVSGNVSTDISPNPDQYPASFYVKTTQFVTSYDNWGQPSFAEWDLTRFSSWTSTSFLLLIGQDASYSRSFEGYPDYPDDAFQIEYESNDAELLDARLTTNWTTESWYGVEGSAQLLVVPDPTETTPIAYDHSGTVVDSAAVGPGEVQNADFWYYATVMDPGDPDAEYWYPEGYATETHTDYKASVAESHTVNVWDHCDHETGAITLKTGFDCTSAGSSEGKGDKKMAAVADSSIEYKVRFPRYRYQYVLVGLADPVPLTGCVHPTSVYNGPDHTESPGNVTVHSDIVGGSLAVSDDDDSTYADLAPYDGWTAQVRTAFEGFASPSEDISGTLQMKVKAYDVGVAGGVVLFMVNDAVTEDYGDSSWVLADLPHDSPGWVVEIPFTIPAGSATVDGLIVGINVTRGDEAGSDTLLRLYDIEMCSDIPEPPEPPVLTDVFVGRQYPRDDQFGLGSAPRILPMPMRSRIHGGLQ